VSGIPPQTASTTSVLPTGSFGSDSQWLRKITLVVSAGSNGLDLSQFRITFRTVQSGEVETPNTCLIRVYNLGSTTVSSVIKEYTRVTLSAGWQQGRFAIIFDGTVKQYRRGRESNIDTYLDIFAADADLLNFAAVNTTIPAPATQQQQLDAINNTGKDYGVNPGYQQLLSDSSGMPGGILPRGKVAYNLYRNAMRGFAKNNDVSWSVINGQLVVVPSTGYMPSDVVQINALTGMVGVPEATDQGITVKCLLNPNLKAMTRIQINNASLANNINAQQPPEGAINQTIAPGQTTSGPNPTYSTFPGFTDLNYFATVTNDGIYRIILVEHEGDTRGNPWYSNIVCLALDSSNSGATAGQHGQTTDQTIPIPSGTTLPPSVTTDSIVAQGGT
jgi:hypothetical protein